MAEQIVITVEINAAGAVSGVTTVNAALDKIVSHTERVARSSALSFDQLFGANFFADVTARMVSAFVTGFQRLIGEAVSAAARMEAAFAGVRGVARNVGISEADALNSIKNLDLVKSGLLTVGEAATSLKNLLATGFGLKESIDLIKALGDTAAFGRQASLTFGYAISSATEGIKNQNSILVDNAGLTKNLSVILKERGFQIQDLYDKVEGASAREALHTGLLKEASIAQGDSVRVLDTYQGKLIQVESAQTRFLAALGESITKNSLVVASLGALVGVLDAAAAGIGGVLALAAAVGILTTAVIALNTQALVASVPAISALITSLRILGGVMVSTATFTTGLHTTLLFAVGGWLAVAAAVGGLLYILSSYSSKQQEVVALERDQVKALAERQAATARETEFLGGLAAGVSRTAEEQARLKTMYDALDPAGRLRVGGINDETAATQRLIAEKVKQREFDEFKTYAEGTRRVKELAAAINERVEAEERQRAAEGRFRNAGTLAMFGREEGAQSRVGRIEAEAVAASGAAEKALRDVGPKIRDAAAAVREFSGDTRVSAADVEKWAAAHGDSIPNIAAVRSELLRLTDEQLNAVPAIDSATDALARQRQELLALAGTMSDDAKRRRETIEGVVNFIAETSAGDVALAKRQLGEFRAENYLGVNEAIAVEQNAKRVRKALDDIVDPKEGRARRAKREPDTELERLSKQLTKLAGDVASFTNLTSREFELRFSVETLERVRRDFEKILDLRRELGLPLETRLPHAFDAEGMRQTIDALERLAEHRDAVRKVTDEVTDAEYEYARALAVSTLPVVNAGTLAEAGYLRAVRERRNAEQELTADLIKLSRLRRDALADEVGQTAVSYLTLKRDLLSQVETLRGDVTREKLLQQIERGGVEFEFGVENKISGRVEITQPQVPKEITNIESHVRSIAERMPAAGDAGAGGGAFSAKEFLPVLRAFLTSRGLDPDKYITATGQSATHNRLDLDHRNAIDVGLSPRSAHGKALAEFAALLQVPNIPVTGGVNVRGRHVPTGDHFHFGEGSRTTAQNFKAGTLLDLVTGASGGSSQPSSASVVERVRAGALAVLGVKSIAELTTPQGAITVLQRLGELFGEGEAVERVTGGTAIGGTVTDLLASRDRLTAEGNVARPRNERDARLRVEAIQQELEAAESAAERQIQFERDVLDARQTFNRQRRDDYRKTTVDIEVLSGELARAEARDAEFVARVQAAARLEHVNARIALNERSVSLDYQIAHAASDAALEYQVAWKEAIYEVSRADVEANKERIAAQVRLADQTVYHADRAAAQVEKYLAAQRSITDVVADFRVGVIEATYKTIDDGLERITRRLGVVGDLIKDVLSGLIRIALNAAFQRLFGGAASGGGFLGGGGGQGGQPGAGGLLDLFLRGGSSGASGTPPFVPAPGGGSFALSPGGFVGGSSGAASLLGLTSLYGSSSGVGAGLTSSYAQAGQQQAASALIHEAAHSQALGGAASGAAGASAFGAAAPLLGLSLGSTLGGAFFQNSRLAGGIGTVAGGALGLAAGLAGYAALGGTFGAGALGSIASTVAGALPIIAPIAAVALIGAYFLNRNARRRQEETQRTEILNAHNKQLDDLISALRSGRISGDDALAQALTVRASYMSAVGELKDSKTRRIAQETVRELDYRINIIKRLAPIVDNARDIDERLVPTFGGGGRFSVADFSGRGLVSVGGYDGRDKYVVAIDDDETIVSPRDRAALGGHERFRQAGVRGYGGGGGNTVSSPSYRPSGSAGGGLAPSKIVVVQVTDDRYADELIAQLSSRGERVLAVKVGNQVRRDGPNGLAGDIAAQFEE